MRFIHAADIHLGVKPDKDKAWSEVRAAEVESTFDKLIDIAEERKVDLLLLAGDVFHTPPGMAQLKNLDYRLSRLTSTRTIIIAGNHDYIEEDSASDIYSFDSNTILLPRECFSNAYLEDINTCVTGFSYGMTEYTQDITEDIGPQMEGAINIFLMHGGDDTHIPFNFKALANAGFDYVELGHIHKPKHMVKNKMAYSGSLEPIDCTETGRRGFIYGQCLNGETRIKWEPLNCRSYINLGFEVKPEYSGAQIIDILKRQIEKLGDENIYKIILQGHMGNGVKPDFSQLKMKYNIYDITDNTMCEYNMDKLLLDNENNLMGKFIKTLSEADDEISKKALKYGVEAMIATGEK
ncbi:MAG: exonuclease SbcCD subunit D [Coprococcus sp.]